MTSVRLNDFWEEMRSNHILGGQGLSLTTWSSTCVSISNKIRLSSKLFFKRLISIKIQLALALSDILSFRGIWQYVDFCVTTHGGRVPKKCVECVHIGSAAEAHYERNVCSGRSGTTQSSNQNGLSYSEIKNLGHYRNSSTKANADTRFPFKTFWTIKEYRINTVI